MKFERMRELALMASRGETGPRNFTADRAWLEAYTRLVMDEVKASGVSLAQQEAIEKLRPWCDGQTVCPPELVGEGGCLHEWCTDALGALVAGKELPSPSEYVAEDAQSNEG